MKANLKNLFNAICSWGIAICIGISFIALHIPLNIKAHADAIMEGDSITIENAESVMEGSSGAANLNMRDVSFDAIPEDTHMQRYFKYMHTYFPNNPANFCVYVSFTMMLSYYDTWWRDDVIGDEVVNGITYRDAYDSRGAETDSPGIHSQLPDTLNEYLADEQIYIKDDFMVKLIGNGYTPEELYGENSKVYNTDIRDCMTDGLTNISRGDYFTAEACTSGNKTSYIKQALDNNHPVMVCIPGHATVAFAYDIDEEGNYFFFAHNGYKDALGNAEIISIYSSAILDAFKLIPNETEYNHKCSDNYTDIPCPCSEENHPAHLEKYEHIDICDVGGHSIACLDNRGSVIRIVSDHGNSVEITGVSYDVHQLHCMVCEHTCLEDHFAYYYEVWYEERYRIFCYCGYSLGITEEFPEELEPYPN